MMQTIFWIYKLLPVTTRLIFSKIFTQFSQRARIDWWFSRIHGYDFSSAFVICHAVSATCIDGLVQDCSNSSALALDLLQCCLKPSVEISSRLDRVCCVYPVPVWFGTYCELSFTQSVTFGMIWYSCIAKSNSLWYKFLLNRDAMNILPIQLCVHALILIFLGTACGCQTVYLRIACN